MRQFRSFGYVCFPVFTTKEGSIETGSYRRAINLVMRKVCHFLIRGKAHIGRTRQSLLSRFRTKTTWKKSPTMWYEEILIAMKWHPVLSSIWYVYDFPPPFIRGNWRRDQSCIGFTQDKDSQYHKFFLFLIKEIYEKDYEVFYTFIIKRI